MERTIYVATVICVIDYGTCEIMEEENIYVGLDYNKAKEAVNNYKRASNCVYFHGSIEHWEDGEEIDSETIRVK